MLFRFASFRFPNIATSLTQAQQLQLQRLYFFAVFALQ